MRYLIAALAIVFAASLPAHAGWNIKQNADGSTVWQDDEGNTVPVGDAGLTVEIDDLSTGATRYVVSHKDGKVKFVYSTNDAAFTAGSANPNLTISIGSGDAVGTFTPISLTSTGSSSHIVMVTTTAGYLNSYEPADSNVSVSQGGVIAIATDGASTGTVQGQITIIVE